MTNDRLIRKTRPHLERLFRDTPWVKTGRLPLSAEALVAWTLHEILGATIVFVTDGRHSLDAAHRNLYTLAPGHATEQQALLYYPAGDAIFADDAREDPELLGYRLEVLERLATPGPIPPVITTSIQALMQRPPAAAALTACSIVLEVGGQTEMDDVVEHLVGLGYEIASEVDVKGQACRRGGIIDVWPPTAPWPVRVEFFGSDIESMRRFDPATQRSLDPLVRLVVPPLRETAGADAGCATDHVVNHLSGPAAVLWSGRDRIEQHARLFHESAAEAGQLDRIDTLATLQSLFNDRADTRQLLTATGGPDDTDLALTLVPSVPELRDSSFAPDAQESARQRLLAALMQRAHAGQAVNVYLETPGARNHFLETLPRDRPKGLQLCDGSLSEGLICEPLQLVLVAESDLYGKRAMESQRYRPQAAQEGPAASPAIRIADLADIEPGELVVHVEHGLGKYLGLFDIVVNGKPQEVLSVEYADQAKLHIPVSQAHLLSRYVGVSPHRVRLHRLGGRRWNRERADADEAIMDFASALVELQAERALLEGFVFDPDTTWQHEFEASFPYRETNDQARVIEEVRSDMQSHKPMDRLLCGDAGYGKTEVAMRAAFKAVMNEKQVAVLVPTTVLAQQHFDTFRQRMAGYPIRVELLSRFRSQGQRRRVIEEMQTGAVDIVIGTHALLNPRVQFNDLGLVLIDEEQRFGVAHKEQLKQLRRLVDVLTLTATPIPRTLYMSLTGAKDISLLQTPPRERMAIETVVAKNTDEVVRHALLRETNREGQAFYLYNRVATIHKARQRLEALVPEVRFGIAHGQMPAGELAAIMHAFVAGEFDVLICTTIIESGLDIPRVNTILIDRADRFGIADLYQLRGRVGRSDRKAYAYLLLPERGHIEPDARRRIAALQKFSGLSSGLHLAMRDLEIRGAGNLLGASQSGHINAIGFGLYCQVLNRTIARLKNEPLPPIIDVTVKLDFISLTPTAPEGAAAATIPYTYIDEEPLRVAMYRRLAEITTATHIGELRAELRDRFGPLPGETERLLRLADLRLAGAAKGLSLVEAREGKVRLKAGSEYLMRNKRFPRLAATEPDDQLAEVIEWIETCERWRDA